MQGAGRRSSSVNPATAPLLEPAASWGAAMMIVDVAVRVPGLLLVEVTVAVLGRPEGGS